MKRMTSIAIGALAAGTLLLAPTAAEAQFASSLTAGIAGPTGDAGDILDTGFTIQGRAELSLLVAGLHANAGFTRLSGKDLTIAGQEVSTEDTDLWNVGVGARLGLGALFWVGANGNYYFAGGDFENEFGIVPEVGASIGPLEAVADFKVTGDINFWSLRAGIRF